MDFSDDSISIPRLAPDDDDQTHPDLAALNDWDHGLYDKSPTIQNVANTGAAANNCGVISSIAVLLKIEEIRKLLQRKANAAARKTETERTLRDKFCYGLQEMCLRPTDSIARGQQLTNLCKNQLQLGSGGANTLKVFRLIIQRIPFAETLFKSSDAPSDFEIMRPLHPSKKALCPAFGGVTKKNLIGWLEAVNAESFSADLGERQNPYFNIKNWSELNHSVAWLKISDDEFEMISNETHQQMNPHEKVHLEMVVVKRDRANLH